MPCLSFSIRQYFIFFLGTSESISLGRKPSHTEMNNQLYSPFARQSALNGGKPRPS